MKEATRSSGNTENDIVVFVGGSMIPDDKERTILVPPELAKKYNLTKISKMMDKIGFIEIPVKNNIKATNKTIVTESRKKKKEEAIAKQDEEVSVIGQHNKEMDGARKAQADAKAYESKMEAAAEKRRKSKEQATDSMEI